MSKFQALFFEDFLTWDKGLCQINPEAQGIAHVGSELEHALEDGADAVEDMRGMKSHLVNSSAVM